MSILETEKTACDREFVTLETTTVGDKIRKFVVRFIGERRKTATGTYFEDLRRAYRSQHEAHYRNHQGISITKTTRRQKNFRPRGKVYHRLLMLEMSKDKPANCAFHADKQTMQYLESLQRQKSDNS